MWNQLAVNIEFYKIFLISGWVKGIKLSMWLVSCEVMVRSFWPMETFWVPKIQLKNIAKRTMSLAPCVLHQCACPLPHSNIYVKLCASRLCMKMSSFLFVRRVQISTRTCEPGSQEGLEAKVGRFAQKFLCFCREFGIKLFSLDFITFPPIFLLSFY